MNAGRPGRERIPAGPSFASLLCRHCRRSPPPACEQASTRSRVARVGQMPEQAETIALASFTIPEVSGTLPVLNALARLV